VGEGCRPERDPLPWGPGLPKTRPAYWLATWLWLVAMLLASCAQPQLAATPAPVVLHLAGSTSMQPLLHDLAAAYSERYPNVSFDWASMGSTAGLEVLRRGNADLALVSRELLPDEEVDALSSKALLAYTVIAEDAIAIIVNEKNPLRGLSLHELRKIFAGQASRWDELGGPAMDITVVSREDGSATRDVFEALTMNGRGVTSMALIMPGSQAVTEYVAAHEGAIGYVSIGYLGPGVTALAIEGVQPSRGRIEDGSYPLTRPFLLVTLPNPGSAVTAFVQFAQSVAGQAIVQRIYAGASSGIRR
jgi:phosphate transport system substrate-binding protein